MAEKRWGSQIGVVGTTSGWEGKRIVPHDILRRKIIWDHLRSSCRERRESGKVLRFVTRDRNRGSRATMLGRKGDFVTDTRKNKTSHATKLRFGGRLSRSISRSNSARMNLTPRHP